MIKLTKPEPIYCRHCGAKLTDDLTVDHYDEQTGERVYRNPGKKKCYNRFCNSKDDGSW